MLKTIWQCTHHCASFHSARHVRQKNHLAMEKHLVKKTFISDPSEAKNISRCFWWSGRIIVIEERRKTHYYVWARNYANRANEQKQERDSMLRFFVCGNSTIPGLGHQLRLFMYWRTVTKKVLLWNAEKKKIEPLQSIPTNNNFDQCASLLWTGNFCHWSSPTWRIINLSWNFFSLGSTDKSERRFLLK